MAGKYINLFKEEDKKSLISEARINSIFFMADEEKKTDDDICRELNISKQDLKKIKNSQEYLNLIKKNTELIELMNLSNRMLRIGKEGGVFGQVLLSLENKILPMLSENPLSIPPGAYNLIISIIGEAKSVISSAAKTNINIQTNINIARKEKEELELTGRAELDKIFSRLTRDEKAQFFLEQQDLIEKWTNIAESREIIISE